MTNQEKDAIQSLLDAATWCVALCEEIGATETNAYAAAKEAIQKHAAVSATAPTEKG